MAPRLHIESAESTGEERALWPRMAAYLSAPWRRDHEGGRGGQLIDKHTCTEKAELEVYNVMAVPRGEGRQRAPSTHCVSFSVSVAR